MAERRRCRPASSCRITRCTATPFPQKTTVWFAYDSDYLYVAFKCDDPDPSGIKTSITRRDNIFQDDWVGLSLDALGTGQVSYHMMVNPSGVQLDMLNSVAGNEDPSPDWIWDSAGRLTETGYAVEIRLPLQSIRFKGGIDPRMGILFWRRVSRSGVSVSWPALGPGVWVFERHASLRFDNLAPRLAREILPSATYSRTELRESPARWAPGDGRGDVGVERQGRPDVDDYTRCDRQPRLQPGRKRLVPGRGQSALPGVLRREAPVLHGRRRGLRAGGRRWRRQHAADRRTHPAHHRSHLRRQGHGQRRTRHLRHAVGRQTKPRGEPRRPTRRRPARIDSSTSRGRSTASDPSNYVGALFTDTSFAGSYNRVVGADFKWRLTDTQRIEAFALASRSRVAAEGDPSGGFGAQVNYNYSTRQWVAAGSFEHYDEDFEMATAFMNRVGVTGAWGYVERNFYPDNNRLSWLHRFLFFSFTQGGHDHFAGGNEFVEVAGVRMFFTRQGFLQRRLPGWVRTLGGPALQARAAAPASGRCSCSLAGTGRRVLAPARRCFTIP